MKNLIYFSLILFVFTAGAQDDVITKADYAFDQGNFVLAHELYQQSGEIYLAAYEFQLYVLSNLKMAKCHLETGAFMQVITQCDHITSYLNEVLPDAAALKVSTLLMRAEALLKLGKYDEMVETLTLAEQSLQDTESLLAAECYNDLGVAFWNNKNDQTAISYHEKALNIRRKMLDKTDPLIADSYLNLGLIAMEDDFLQSVIYFNNALQIYRAAYGNNHPQVALCFSNLAFANSYQKNHTEALKFMEETLKIWNHNYIGDHANKAFTLSNKGKILKDQGNYDQSLLMLQEALQMYLRLYGEKHPEVANTHYLIGSVQMAKKDFRTAIESFQKSIYANLYDQHFSDIYQLPEIKNYFSGDILLFSLQYKAQALEALHFEKSLNLRDIKAALNTYLKCDDLIGIIRHARLTESDKIKIGQISTDVYESGIRVAQYLSEKTFNGAYYRQMAFTFCERSKSSVLLESISDTKAKSFAGIPDEILSYEDSLKRQISWLELQMASNPEEPKLSTIKNAYFEIQQNYRTLIERLETEYPNYFKLKYDNPDIDLKELQDELGSETALISYFIASKIIYVFVVDQKHIKIINIPRSEDLMKLTKGLRNGIKYSIKVAFEHSSLALYDQLIPKIPSSIHKLIIIPDGLIGAIPFETLLTKDGETQTYLLEKYDISYNYAASLLLSEDGMNDKKSSGILLAAPISFTDNAVKMGELPGSEQEVREIKYLFLSSEEKPETWLRGKASESALKSSALSDYRFLHFATHGIVNESKPERSCIFMSPEADEDGSLYSGEIYNLKINADLVTLSACETGLGKVAKGEGIIGLSRALMYAGAKNLILSLWQVSDASTANLMIEFYKQHLYHSDDEYFSTALRSAKLSLLKSDQYTNPYYWAPFILIGR